MSLCHELSFTIICNNELLQSAPHFSLQSINETNFESLEFHPFLVYDGKYNTEIEVKEFFVHNRFNAVPKSRYVSLDNPPRYAIEP